MFEVNNKKGKMVKIRIYWPSLTFKKNVLFGKIKKNGYIYKKTNYIIYTNNMLISVCDKFYVLDPV